LDDKDSGSKSNDQYDGVVYESTRNISRREDHARPRKKQSKNNMAAFYIVTLVIAILLCMIIFTVVFQSIINGRKTSPSPSPPPPTAAETASESALPVGLPGCTGVIKVMDPSGAWIDILDVSAGTSYHLIIKSNTKLQDKSGSPLILQEFEIGDIVDAKYDPQTNETGELTKSSNAWVIRERANILINTGLKTITIDNDAYSYNDNLVTLYNGKPFSLDLLQPIDTLTIAGVRNTVWRVTLVKGHGTLYISNAGNIANGKLELDNSMYGLEDINPIAIPEGTHHLVIKGDNIETYISDIVIEANKSQYIKLEDIIKLKAGWLSVQVNTQDYRLYVDNEEKTPDQPVNLTYGSHTVRVEKEGYIKYEQTIDFHDLSSSIKVDLHPLFRLGKIIATSKPDGAQVYVDSAYVGDTPVSVSIEIGQHTLLVSKDGYKSISFSVNVDKDAEPYNPVDIELNPDTPPVTFTPYVPPPEPSEWATPSPPPEEETESPPATEIPTPAQPGIRTIPFSLPGIFRIFHNFKTHRH